MKKKLPIKWDTFAVENLNSIYNYIAKDSISTAKYVKKSIVLLVKTLNDFPEKHAEEFYLTSFPNNFRSISKWSYKIIYEITENEIIILDIFHTSQNPEKIKDIPK